MHRLLLLFTLCSTAIGQISGQAQSGDEMRIVGRAVVNVLVEEHGRVSNAAWDADIQQILPKLKIAAYQPTLHVEYVIVDDPSMNAAAVPGGFLVINAGAIRSLTKFAGAKGKPIPQLARERYMVYLAAVLAHELAHLTLGHTDSLFARAKQRAEAAGLQLGELTDDDIPQLTLALQEETDALADLANSRERELEADQIGALYLLRAGWTIQDAMDLFRDFDAMERGSPDFESVEAVTYFRSHPRASHREAGLEGFRARLKVLQSDLDDAIGLIRGNVAVEAAIPLLDSVLVYFPDLLAARHARGAAYHQLWLNSVPLQTQRVRASLLTFGARFIDRIRGIPGNLDYLRAARSDYDAVLAKQSHPRTLSNSALLDAYTGDVERAKRRASTAAAQEPANVEIRNNLGVVLFLTGDYAAAAQEFKKAYDGSGVDRSPAFLFNLGAAEQAAGIASGQQHLQDYLAVEDGTDWRAEALRLLGRPAAGPTSRTSSPPPPAVAGVHLGSRIEGVLDTFGPPDSVRQVNERPVWHYPDRGLVIVWSPREGVVAILVGVRLPDDVAGIRVGDTRTAAHKAWGNPAEVSGDVEFFDRGSWVGSLRIGPDQSVTAIGVILP